MPTRVPLLVLGLTAACASARPPRTTAVDATALAHDHERRGAFAAGREVLTAAVDRARGARQPVARLTAELARVWSHETFARNRGYAEGVSVARAAQAAARSERDPRALAIALDAEGMLHYGTLVWAGASDYSVPRRHFAAAVDAFRTADDQGGLAEATFHVGLSFEQAGDAATAAQHYTAAQALADQAGDLVVASYTERHLAGIAEERGDLRAARRGFERSLTLRERTGYLRLVPYAMMAIASLDLHAGETARALASYRRALVMAERIGNEAMLLWAHVGVGEALEKLDDLTGARAHFERALAIAETASISIAIVAAARSAASVVETLGDPAGAQAFRDRATRAELAGKHVSLL
ncbi:MAG: tetratricopeptide repeat protein [Kofleriaceae bacterium]